MDHSNPASHPLRRTNNVDLLRLVLAVAVVYSHSFPLGTGNGRNEPLALWTSGGWTIGRLSVGGFFVLSGYLVTASWGRSGGILPFMARRVRRIYPGFVTAMAVCAWVVVPLAGAGMTAGTGVWSPRFVAHWAYSTARLRAFAAPPVFAGNPFPVAHAVNGSAWSISYEFLCYLLVAGFGRVGFLSGRGRHVVAAMFGASLAWCWAAEVAGYRPSWGRLAGVLGDPGTWASLLPLYLAGVVAYLYRDRLRPAGWSGMLALAALILGSRSPLTRPLVLPTVGAWALLCAAFPRQPVPWDATRRGDWSYGVYLYAFPIQQLIVAVWGRPMDPHLLFGLALVASLATGAASWHGVEKRFLGRRNQPRRARA
jgi:peptidoglycan/LPS O-acetylase OafA/YrhL